MGILSVGEVLVERDILDSFFSCDLNACRGCCCVEGELGAPLSEAEATLLQHPPGEVLRMLPDANRQWIARHGTVEDYQGSLYTRTLSGRECVFALIREGVTLCALEIACNEGKTAFPKPLSCRLFPLRVRKKFGLPYLVYEQHGMCRHARLLGTEQRVPLVEYLRPHLEELYGKAWVRSLISFSDSISDPHG
ncbi:DUF3109 family protein [Chlorobium phaeovibrioides]|uniref:DUF3109 family protein n=1 Tax=Chlorobium phaeovibrioides TaxID=1094 RepID=A0A3S0L279_CHLPH|nr:DUF3109 family protein [Chlorobium phaeovibrioides]KAA6232658.1 DUF3109 family protein [Chlorobium phaeovibrioides]MWV53731.1 DUF3109 family protein [Chlorobium phaeovibrioides]QEQ56949.1 DUF3109 family protein [Chlorobium phaeovibrioides]RTY37411.1 DUF3109 family protein [Chlorobium phaeovibrioides]RTY39905.1 DUF3109 family protein [Chlorobium phaeovibrioides]